ncbi:MAG: NAD(P)H-hydrate epimerase, partial [Lentisphaeria bacterium]|nr:NAD(P)H-hydrate epimerase [Lentisphaeria bacterium]
MKIVTVEEMRALDRETIRDGVPGHLLMERAGQGAFQEIRRFLGRLEPQHRQRLTILAGKGNNGGDAYVVARLAAHASLSATVYATCTVDELTGDAKKHALAAKRCVRIVPCDRLPDDALTPGTVIIDGLLGTGATGALRPPCDAFVAQINAANLPVIALDIPSGLDGDTGQVADTAIHADLTITMALPKRGLLTPEGLRHSGVLRCIDIGIPNEAVENTAGVGDALFSSDIAPLLRRRPHDGHKGTFGHVLIAGGSRWYGGAPFLAASAALRSGAGLATVAIPEGCLPPTSGVLAALIVRRLPSGETGVLGPKACAPLVELASRAQAIVFGPGIGTSPASAAALKVLADQPLPLVLDADALRLAARHRDMLVREGDTILTPHPGEMRALLSGLGL